MPSQLHELLVSLFRDRPSLAAVLAREALGASLPPYTEARIESEDLPDLQPAAYRADLVVLLHDTKPTFGFVVEVQLTADKGKWMSWPAYAVNLRARIRCPVAVLVITPYDDVARWAATPIELGGDNRFVPWVIGPSGIPEIEDAERATSEPEVAVLSAMAHGRSPDLAKAQRIGAAAIAASLTLPSDRSVLYFDVICASLSDAARAKLLTMTMDPAKYEFQSEFAKRYLSQGRAEGEAQGEARGRAEGEARGRAETLLRLLSLKFGELEPAVIEHVRSAAVSDLERWTERVLSATSLDAVLRS